MLSVRRIPQGYRIAASFTRCYDRDCEGGFPLDTSALAKRQDGLKACKLVCSIVQSSGLNTMH